MLFCGSNKRWCGNSPVDNINQIVKNTNEKPKDRSQKTMNTSSRKNYLRQIIFEISDYSEGEEDSFEEGEEDSFEEAEYFSMSYKGARYSWSYGDSGAEDFKEEDFLSYKDAESYLP
eukprot:UN09861